MTKDEVSELLELTKVKTRNVDELSGGELQRFAISMVCIQVNAKHLPACLYIKKFQTI